MMYPLIYFFIWVWAVIVRFIQATGGNIDLGFYEFASVTIPFNGFVDGIWFGYSREIFKNVARSVWHCKGTVTPTT